MITIELIEQFNYVLAVLGVATFLATALLVYDLKTKQALAPFVTRYGLYTALILTLGASALTLTYSEIFGFIPCGLCWLERMALYPQILIIAIALYIKDKTMPVYGIALSVFGFVVSLYHHYIQMGGAQFIKCPVAGAGADCAKRFFFEFGFMTFPLMSVALFAFLITLYVYIRKIYATN